MTVKLKTLEELTLEVERNMWVNDQDFRVNAIHLIKLLREYPSGWPFPDKINLPEKFHQLHDIFKGPLTVEGFFRLLNWLFNITETDLK